MLIEGEVGTVERPPDRPTLIYDDACDLCRGWVGRLRRWDRNGAVKVLPLQSPFAEEVSGRRRVALSGAAHLVCPDGTVFAGAAAARELFRYLRGGWFLTGLLRLPGAMFVAERLYRWIARTWGPVR